MRGYIDLGKAYQLRMDRSICFSQVDITSHRPHAQATIVILLISYDTCINVYFMCLYNLALFYYNYNDF